MVKEGLPKNMEEQRSVLLRNLKREVKQIMEEAVTRKFVNEESSSVTSLCCAVEACLVHCVKRRVLGLFGGTTTFGLLLKIGATCPPANSIAKQVLSAQQKYIKENKSSVGSFDIDKTEVMRAKDLPVAYRYLWIRLALFEKVLAIIVDYLVKNANFVSALVGPCALEYSKVKTQDHLWIDPSADELIQRHRISTFSPLNKSPASAGCSSPKSPRPSLNVKRTASLGPDELLQKLSSFSRDCVGSFHQTYKSTLLYGKNNVVVHPADSSVPLAGYLSLHQNASGSLSVRWTPNDLIHSHSVPSDESLPAEETPASWKCPLNIQIDDIVYIHVHQKDCSSGSIIFVAADGIQHPPIVFPPGQHPLAFLSCLENGLLPWGRLDPPLWLQKGKGKVFPKYQKRKPSINQRSVDAESQENDPKETREYVFRIITVNKPNGFVYDIKSTKQYQSVQSSATETSTPSPTCAELGNDKIISLSSLSIRLKERIMSLGSQYSSPTGAASISRKQSQSSQPATPPNIDNGEQEAEYTLKTDLPNGAFSCGLVSFDKAHQPASALLQNVCDSMRQQILCRAFYGWLAHCRNLRTIRTHLSCLVYAKNENSDEEETSTTGLTRDSWKELLFRNDETSALQLYHTVYYGGIADHSLRKEVWPFLLGLLKFKNTEAERHSLLRDLQSHYESTVTEWLSVEAIVKQRDVEALKAARNSRGSQNNDISVVGRGSLSVSSDVFSEGDPNTTSCSGVSSAGQKPISPSDSGVSTAEKASVFNRELASSVESDESTPCAAKSRRKKNFYIAEDSGRSTPEEGDGGIFSKELVETFAINLHRIEKDVHRCDRNYPYFTVRNLEKLKNVMCTFVWEHLEVGYIQGMCDLAGPLLVVFDDEVLTYSCFCELMKRMVANFPHGGQMEIHFANMRALLQVLDPELLRLFQDNGDYTHFYFCYRWFLLDFKRELVYDDVFRVWETIWASIHISSPHFVLFVALALIQYYRDIIIENGFDFTDIIKFFNEMAEKHDATYVLFSAKNLVKKLQTLIDNGSRN